jgi:protein-tyrosine phosphatase
MPDEVAEFALEAEDELCKARGIRFISFAIPDRGVPTSKAVAALVQKLEQALKDGKNIALHCRQSVGRSALIAALLFVVAGEEPHHAFERISLVRGCKVPDTAEQEHWVAGRVGGLSFLL